MYRRSVDDIKYTSKIHAFLKGEVFIAALLRQGYTFDQLVTGRSGSFAKSYRKDIEDVQQKTDDQDNPYLQITLNRDGIYDRLPEGLFHQPRAHGTASAAVQQMVSEYKRFREEEKAARRFFQPVEQEMLRFAVMAEQEESEAFWGLLSGDADHIFPKFWDLPEDLPAAAAAVLLRILPWAHLIKGDPKLSATALGMILGKEVQVTECLISNHVKETAVFCLGDSGLGTDTVTGNCFQEPAGCWAFTIRDVKETEIMAFPGHAPYGRLLQQFIDIFMPLEIDTTFIYETIAADHEMTTNVLGYNFTL